MKTNIFNIFEKTVAQNPGKIALYDKGQSITFSDLKMRVDQCAFRYRSKGIKHGTKVLVLIPISIDLYVNVLALFKIGAVVVFTDEWVDKKRLSVCIDIVGVDVLVSNTKGYFYSFVHSGLRQVKRKVRYKRSTKTDNVDTQTAPGDSALITFTTGSTGIPKAANRTHQFLSAQYEELFHLLEPIASETMLTTLPIVALCCIGIGMTTVIPSYNHKDPKTSDLNILKSEILNHQVKSIICSPFLVHQISRFSGELNSQVNRIFVGGAAVFPEEASRWKTDWSDTDIKIIYGSTEAEPISELGIDSFIAKSQLDANGGICVGPINENISCKIIEPVDGDIRYIDDVRNQADGKVGEIIVAGNHVLQDYYNSPEATKQNKIQDTDQLWHRTGDAGYIIDGDIYLVGRVSQMVPIEGGTTGIFIIEHQLNNIDGIKKGTVINKDGKNYVIINGKISTEFRGAIKKDFHAHSIITDIAIPMDPRHNSKIDYGRLERKLMVYLSK